MNKQNSPSPFGATEINFDDSGKRPSAAPKVSLPDPPRTPRVPSSPFPKVTQSFYQLAAACFLEGYALQEWAALSDREKASLVAPYRITGGELDSAMNVLQRILALRSQTLHRFHGEVFKEH